MLYYEQEVKHQEEKPVGDRTEYFVNYAKENLKRVPLDVRKDYYTDVLQEAAKLSGMSVNGFIKAAIAEKIARDCLDLPDIKA